MLTIDITPLSPAVSHFAPSLYFFFYYYCTLHNSDIHDVHNLQPRKTYIGSVIPTPHVTLEQEPEEYNLLTRSAHL